MKAIVTFKEFPLLARLVADALSAPIPDPVGYTVPLDARRPDKKLREWEIQLSQLSDDDRLTFAAGEVTEQRALAERYGLQELDAWLTTMFNDTTWPYLKEEDR